MMIIGKRTTSIKTTTITTMIFYHDDDKGVPLKESKQLADLPPDVRESYDDDSDASLVKPRAKRRKEEKEEEAEKEPRGQLLVQSSLWLRGSQSPLSTTDETKNTKSATEKKELSDGRSSSARTSGRLLQSTVLVWL